MNLTKKRVLSLLMVLCLMFAFAACGSDDGGSDQAGGDQSGSDAATLMDKDTYLAEVDGLNSAAEEFTKVCADFISSAASNSDDLDALTEAIEKVRATKQPFLDFGAITNPPEGYEDAHKKLADNSAKFGDLIDKYCDVLIDTLNGEENADAETIQTDMETVINDLSAAMSEVQAIG